jgi:hypothetical protein
MQHLFQAICRIPIVAFAQSVAIGAETPRSSAMLEVSSASKGLLVLHIIKVLNY